jgi:hypothetical protein
MKHIHTLSLSSRLYRRRSRRPSIRLTHRPLPHHSHDISLHMLDILLQIIIFRLEPSLAAAVECQPACDNEGCDGDGDGEENPDGARDGGVCVCKSQRGSWGKGGEDVPAAKSKNVMLNIDETRVPGRKTAPRREIVFMAVLSRLLAWARRRCSPAIWNWILDSRCERRLYS